MKPVVFSDITWQWGPFGIWSEVSNLGCWRKDVSSVAFKSDGLDAKSCFGRIKFLICGSQQDITWEGHPAVLFFLVFSWVCGIDHLWREGDVWFDLTRHPLEPIALAMSISVFFCACNTWFHTEQSVAICAFAFLTYICDKLFLWSLFSCHTNSMGTYFLHQHCQQTEVCFQCLMWCISSILNNKMYLYPRWFIWRYAI